MVTTRTHSYTAAAKMTGTGDGAVAGGDRGSCALQAKGWIWRSHGQLERKRDILREETPASLGDSSSAQTQSSVVADTMNGTGAGTSAVAGGERGSCALRARGCLQRAHGRLGQKSPILRE